MKKTFEYFTHKETILNIALLKVKGKLEWFNQESAKIEGSTVDIPAFKNWNNWHDLQYRIEQRLWANWSEFKDYNWDKNQFNTYP